MPSVTSYSPTSNAYVNGVLGDYKWATTALTFSFPTSASYYGSNYGSGEVANNFAAMNTAQQSAVRSALTAFASISNLAFTQVAETSTRHGDLRFAQSDLPGTAWAYTPGDSAEGGDSWFNRSNGYYSAPVKGNYAHTTFLHEIGHALGLEHAHEHYAMPAARDSMEYTVMSYRSYVGASATAGYSNETGGFAQSLMMYDIAAIQHMYGADYGTNSGATVYSWNAGTGQAYINGAGQGAPVANRIFQTIWDGGGTDTYDFSNYATALKINLQPGQWTTTATAQLARLHWDGSKVAVGNIANSLLHNNDPRSLIENAIGGSAGDTLAGNSGANVLNGAGGNDAFLAGLGTDSLVGGVGTDTLRFTGWASGVSINLALTSAQAVAGGSVRLSSIENVVGGNGADTLRGASGANVLDGAAGNDWLHASAGADTLIGGAGADTLSFAGSTAAVRVGLGIVGAQAVSGGSVNLVGIENVTGGNGGDTLTGSTAANTLTGSGGNDILTGGGSSDIFVFSSALNAASNVDRITDFNVPQDTIFLENAIFTALSAVGGMATRLFKNLDLASIDLDDRILYDQSEGDLFYDRDGAAVGSGSVKFADIANEVALTSSDFLVI